MRAQQVQLIKYDDLHKMINAPSDTTMVLSFFASWCKPCLNELPEIIAFKNNHVNDKIKVILLSLDFKSSYQENLLPVLARYQIYDTVYLLDETDANSWMNKVDSSWNGAIPATLIKREKKKKMIFIDHAIDQEILNHYIR